MRVSVLNDALKSMYNAEKIGKRQVMIRPSSKVIIKFLMVMQKHGSILLPVELVSSISSLPLIFVLQFFLCELLLNRVYW